MSPQLRRCVAAVAPRSGVRAAFAICTASLQDRGYLFPNSSDPTPAGRARSRALAAQPEHAEALAAYEAMLARIRTRRPSLPTGSAARVEDGSPMRTVEDATRTLRPLRHALEDVFACDTAYGDCRPDAPSAGHCFLASMLVQDLHGGEIRSGAVDRIPHYWVRLDALDVDVTGDQFRRPAIQVKHGALYGRSRAFDRRPRTRLDASVGRNATVMRLYRRLLCRVAPALRRLGEDALARQVDRIRSRVSTTLSDLVRGVRRGRADARADHLA